MCRAPQRVCEIFNYVPMGQRTRDVLPMANGRVTTQQLGTQTIGGIETIGTRETQTLQGSAAGLDRPVTIVKEFWYSPRLDINVITRRGDPRGGVDVFTVTDINTSEPDAALFELPANIRVVDMRASR